MAEFKGVECLAGVIFSPRSPQITNDVAALCTAIPKRLFCYMLKYGNQVD